MSEAYDTNPFADDRDRAELWDLLVFRDIEAFIDCEWAGISQDFTSAFYGIDANRSSNPDDWSLAFPTLDAYRANWLGFAQSSALRADRDILRRAHFQASSLTRIDLAPDRAVCHKQLDGTVTYRDGSTEALRWKTLYVCAKQPTWKIDHFIGFMPFDALA